MTVCFSAYFKSKKRKREKERGIMLGISYQEFFMIIGVTAALLGPKDLPIIARTAGRLTGRAIGYAQLARGQFKRFMEQSEIYQVHKQNQYFAAKVFEGISNPSRMLVDNFDQTSSTNGAKKRGLETNSSSEVTHLPSAKDHRFQTLAPVDVLSQAIDDSKSAKLAESAGLLPDKKEDIKGSDILLEAVLESQVAYNAKIAQNHLKHR